MANSSAISAVIAGLTDGGCVYSSNYPGSQSQEIFFGLGGKRISINERVAFEQAYGASLAGKRSVVTLKSVGLNVCADPFLHAMIAGVQGGMVIVVVDDTQAVASQERQDSRHFLEFFGGLWLEPSSVEMAYEMARESFELSERFDVPVVIRLTNEFFSASGSYAQLPKLMGSASLATSPSKYISYPVYWRRQYDALSDKRARISAYVEDIYAQKPSPPNDKPGIVVIGATPGATGHSDAPEADRLQINMYPIPVDAIIKFMKDRPHIAIMEQGDDYALSQVQQAVGRRTMGATVISDTGDCPDLPERWITWSHLSKLFSALSNLKPSFVVGDVGQYTVESTHTVDACLCLGSSVGVALGLAEAGVEYPFAVVGDGAFLHSNVAAVTEAFARDSALGVIVLDNNGSGATGGQPLISDIRAINPLIQQYELDYNDASQGDLTGTLETMQTNRKLAVLFVNIRGVKAK